MASTPQIVNVYPAPDSTGIVIGDRISVLFDQEMDEESINSGTFVLRIPTENFVFGPDLGIDDNQSVEDEAVLDSPFLSELPGYIPAIISFQRVDQYGDIVTTQDYTGAGNLYRTLATLTPSRPMAVNVQHTALVLGDEDTDDDYPTGVKTRTVFDTELLSVSGDGRLVFGGGYVGDINAEYTIEITSGGHTGEAEYLWWRDTDPLNAYPGITTTGKRELEEGLWVICEPDGVFTTGDVFHVVCVPLITLEENYGWSFTTGSGSIILPPSDASTSGIVDIGSGGSGVGTTVGSFVVSSITPLARAYNVDTALASIVIVFNNNINASTVAGNVILVSESANEETSFTATGVLVFTPTVSGKTLTLALSSGQLYQNNIIKIQLTSSIKDTTGNALSEYNSYFATEYTPLYTGIRRVRLDLGPLIANIPNETILFAIWEASLSVDAVMFTSTISNLGYLNFAKRELATCIAELFLVRGSQGLTAGDRMSKTLGDLSVSRSGAHISGEDRENDLQECIARWTQVVQSGGLLTPDTSVKSKYAVKGSLSEDAIGFGRTWEPTSTTGGSIGNYDGQATARRWVRTFRKRYHD